MTYYDVAFEEKQYRAVTKKASTYYQEYCDSAIIPLIVTDVPDAYEYRYVHMLEPHASYAGSDWSAKGRRGTVVHNYSDIDLFTQQLNLYFDLNEMNKFGESLIADKRAALIEKWAFDVDFNQFHGPHSDYGVARSNDRAAYTIGGTQLAEGLIGQLTSIQNLKGGGSNSTLTTKGDIWYGINTMIDGIPFDLRKQGPPMIMITDEYVAKEAFAPDRIYQDKVEGDFISEYLMGPKATQGRKIAKWIVSNKILCEATDATAGDNANTIDDVGTDSRIMLFVPDPRFVGRVVSRGFSKVGEDSGALGTTTIYGWKGRSYWFDTDVAEFSEAIAFA